MADYNTLFDLLTDQELTELAEDGSATTTELLEEIGVLVDGELNPTNNMGELYHKRGVANLKLGDYEAAIADFTEYIAQHPDEKIDQYSYKKIEVYVNRGNAFFENGDYEAALADYDTIIELQPDEFSYHKRAELNLNMKQYDSALADLETAVEIDPENNYTYLERIPVYIEMKAYDNGYAL